MEAPQYCDGFTDMWKGRYKDQEVAAKVLKLRKTSDLNQIRKVGGVSFIMSSSELTVSHAVFLQGGNEVEDTSSPESVTTVGRDDVRGSTLVRDGISVDGEREHHPVSEACGRRSVETRMSFFWVLITVT